MNGAYLYRNIPIIVDKTAKAKMQAKDKETSDLRPSFKYAEFSELTQEQKNLDLIAKMNSFLAKLEIEVLQKSIVKQVLFG